MIWAATTIRTLAAGIVMLGLLLLVGISPATAHGTDRPSGSGAHNRVDATFVVASSNVPSSASSCDGLVCCSLGQCSMCGATATDQAVLAVRLIPEMAIYVSHVSAVATDARGSPALPPPRQDA